MGSVKEWVADGVSADTLAKGERRVMDCVDCHNRPSHTFASSAERAVDEALARGVIDRSLPFVRREAVRVLKASYPSQDAAFAGIRRDLQAFYRAGNPAGVPAAKRRGRGSGGRDPAAAVRAQCLPGDEGLVGHYANNIGHMDFPGCFRCHDDEHKAKDGSTITPGLRAVPQAGGAAARRKRRR